MTENFDSQSTRYVCVQLISSVIIYQAKLLKADWFRGVELIRKGRLTNRFCYGKQLFLDVGGGGGGSMYLTFFHRGQVAPP